jgi:hypothetical protein
MQLLLESAGVLTPCVCVGGATICSVVLMQVVPE